MTDERHINGTESDGDGELHGDMAADGQPRQPEPEPSPEDSSPADPLHEDREETQAAERSIAFFDPEVSGDEIRLPDAERPDLEPDDAPNETDEAATASAEGEAAADGADEDSASVDGDDAVETVSGSEAAADAAPGTAKRAASRRRGKAGRSEPGRPATRRKRGSSSAEEIIPLAAPSQGPVRILVNDIPGEECRIAIAENGRLQGYFAERSATATSVGNIYKGRVINVEPAIQAAFVDFGEGANGFLHISDLHPKYFPGMAKTERLGKKIPRRDRPLIQEALRKGQEITVQVIKEGIGTKGPTLTSYISIPGRLLVMMPDMDRVGVSRKVEDEDQRRKMRKILDSLELPEGFGFILRTAGFDRTKTELQRDAAYLARLWKAMEKRMDRTGGPCALYTESDLLIRTIRDISDPSVEAIIVDSASAFDRAKLFLDIVAPRSAPPVLFYDRPQPIFHAFDMEAQVEEIHARAVPLPSGGALVFDQAEALVAIDVNSGRSRAARDSETNAYQTNLEAVREVCRQLRLRDLGGLIVIDFIDMRAHSHRRAVEDCLRQEMRRDRAKATFLPISDFGIVEMTRQRMRPSLRKTHFSDCPHCLGHGEVRMPDAVAGDSLRRIALLFAHDRVHRVELVCSSRVASELLSSKRQALHELEAQTGKRIEVRISEAFATDRIEVYAYDDRNADIETDRLGRLGAPAISELHTQIPEDLGVAEGEDDGPSRRRRRRKPAPADATSIALAGGFDDLPEVDADERPILDEIDDDTEDSADGHSSGESTSRAHGGDGADSDRSDRGRGRRGRGDRRGAGNRSARSQPAQSDGSSADGDGRGRRRRRRRKSVELAVLARELRYDPAALLARLQELVPDRAAEFNEQLTSIDGETAALVRRSTTPRPAQQTEGEGGGRRGRRGRRRRRRDVLADLPVPEAPMPTAEVADQCRVSVAELIDHLRCATDEATATTLTDELPELSPELVIAARWLYSPRWFRIGAADPDAATSDADGESGSEAGDAAGQEASPGRDDSSQQEGQQQSRRGKRVRGRRGRGGGGGNSAHSNSNHSEANSPPMTADESPKRGDALEAAPAAPEPAPPSAAASAAPKRRSLYGSVIRKLGLGRSGSPGREE